MITVKLESNQGGRLNVSQVYSILKRYWPPTVAESVRTMRGMSNGAGACFDLYEDQYSRFMDNWAHLKDTDRGKLDFDVCKCAELPELNEDDAMSAGGSGGYGDGGYGGGGGGGGGHRGGGGFRGGGGRGGGFDSGRPARGGRGGGQGGGYGGGREYDRDARGGGGGGGSGGWGGGSSAWGCDPGIGSGWRSNFDQKQKHFYFYPSEYNASHSGRSGKNGNRRLHNPQSGVSTSANIPGLRRAC